jgi:hypothetical protein
MRRQDARNGALRIHGPLCDTPFGRSWIAPLVGAAVCTFGRAAVDAVQSW